MGIRRAPAPAQFAWSSRVRRWLSQKSTIAGLCGDSLRRARSAWPDSACFGTSVGSARKSPRLQRPTAFGGRRQRLRSRIARRSPRPQSSCVPVAAVALRRGSLARKSPQLSGGSVSGKVGDNTRQKSQEAIVQPRRSLEIHGQAQGCGAPLRTDHGVSGPVSDNGEIRFRSRLHRTKLFDDQIKTSIRA